MSSVPPPPEKRWPSGAPQVPHPYAPVQKRAPFSKAAIAGFIISCVGLFVFAMVGPLGTALSGIGLRRARDRGLRGRGLAIAGMIIGIADFAFYLVARYLLNP
ncbi:hypothetical protein BMF89_07895 [Arthrobacter sp. SRS-W-1-2016]|jgi:hypothetical protein|uniref:DUF4190 domain-containing protein n=1 Tax=Arthrobacter sp. SRS-W-1-2016 TaxID=1930254 RepID=UPI000990C147|nr:DUF4190 domain-containing protein [Arthrobacter sp. SRS-W-1-2016]OOP62793.1 hypothetical protein BMF89_07895 [Arthrobacter sp. SRS-W-1-2016]